MGKHDSDTHKPRCHDKQLRDVSLEAVLEKRRLGQALNAKEFSVCAGVSYSTARHWFHLPGFPVFQGVVFWDDFVNWRSGHFDNEHPPASEADPDAIIAATKLPPRAAKILLD